MKGDWPFIRLSRGIHPGGTSFEAEAGNFRKGWSFEAGNNEDLYVRSVDSDDVTYVIDGSFISKKICNLVLSATPWWTADCIVSSADGTSHDDIFGK